MSVLDEVDAILSELIDGGAHHVAIVQAAEEGARALGSGRWLIVEDAPDALAGRLAEAVILLRAAQRRLGAPLEPVRRDRADPEPDPVRRARARVVALVSALAVTEGAAAAALIRRGDVVTEAGALDAGRRLELELLVRRVAADGARRRGTSHGELAQGDVYARSVGLDGTLVLFFERPWSRDFVRHRAARIARELGFALPHLDPAPPPPAVAR